MLLVHTFPTSDVFADKPDNYFRVSKKTGGDSHVFPFASGDHSQAHWAYAESLRVFTEFGGTKSALRSLWKSHPDFKRVELVGEGDPIEDETRDASASRKTRARALTEPN